jgi:hypothetical protein
MTNVNVATTATVVLTAGQGLFRPVFLQNQSDTTMYLAVGVSNIAQLTSSFGVKIDSGESLTLTAPQCDFPVSAIHGASGTKVLHVQILDAN